MKIQVEGQDGHLPFKSIEMEVIPRVGEYLEIDDETYEVQTVVYDLENDQVRLEVE